MSRFIESEEMATCSFCDSGTFKWTQIDYQRIGVVTYCEACWKDIFKGQEK